VLPETHGFAVRVQVKTAAGYGFAGMGAGWTSPTRTIPMCHPSRPTNRAFVAWMVQFEFQGDIVNFLLDII